MPKAWSGDPLQLLTVAEVAQLLCVKPKTVYAWVAAGKFPALKLNGVVRFRRPEVEAYVQRHVVSAPVKGPGRPFRGSLDEPAIEAIVTRVKRTVCP
jgi:excisionase family DNA binding protein